MSIKLNPQVECPECSGSGEISAPWSLEGPDRQGCPVCGGEGTISAIKKDLYLEREAAVKASKESDPFDMAQEERLWPSVEFDDVTY